MVHLLVVLIILVNMLVVFTITIYSQVQRVLQWQEEGRSNAGYAGNSTANTFVNFDKYI